MAARRGTIRVIDGIGEESATTLGGLASGGGCSSSLELAPGSWTAATIPPGQQLHCDRRGGAALPGQGDYSLAREWGMGACHRCAVGFEGVFGAEARCDGVRHEEVQIGRRFEARQQLPAGDGCQVRDAEATSVYEPAGRLGNFVRFVRRVSCLQYRGGRQKIPDFRAPGPTVPRGGTTLRSFELAGGVLQNHASVDAAAEKPGDCAAARSHVTSPLAGAS